MSTHLITIENLSKVFPKAVDRSRVSTLHNVNLTIHKGEFLLLLGPSGCGKSTLLRIISGLDTPTSGTVSYNEMFKKENMSFVFQNFGLLPWLSVSDNVSLGLIGRKISEGERKQKVKTILERFGLHVFAQHYPKDLSGGMKQRVGLARAFVTDPEVIFLDEPFSELDFYTAETLRKELLSLWKEKGTTVVMVSHYVEEAVELADRIAVFTDRPGTVKTVVKNDLTRPRNHREEPFFKLEDEILSHFGESRLA